MTVDFNHDIDLANKRILIVDLDLGGRSVTNTMDVVLTAIFLMHNEHITEDNLHEWTIHYLDSTNRWDGVRVESFRVKDFRDRNAKWLVVDSVSFYPIPKDQY